MGLGAYSSYYQQLGNVGPEYNDSHFRVPVQLTVGYEFCPRLAVQVGAAYSGNSRDLAVITYNSPVSPTGYSQSYATFTYRNVSVSALARYTITNPAARLQFAVLGGMGLEHAGGRTSGVSYTSPSGQVSDTYESRYSTNILLASLGAGLRYRLTPRFELNYDFTENRALASDSRAYMTRSLTASHALGLRYRFGEVKAPGRSGAHCFFSCR